ncbi:MAG: hypothetical protein WD579_00365 [Candidatus Paceibacterota bacterium]
MRSNHKGFVAYSKEQGGEHVWYVKVDEPRSPHHLKPCVVVNRNDNFTLQPGLEVEFILDNPEGTDKLFAHAVAPLISRVEGEAERRVDENSDPKYELVIVVTRFRDGRIRAELINCISREQIEEEWHREMPGEAEVIGYLPFTEAFQGVNYDHIHVDPNAKDALLSLAGVDGIQEAFESLLTRVYNLNRNENKD